MCGITPITEVHNSIQPMMESDSIILVNSRNLNTTEITKEKAENLCLYYKNRNFNVIYASGENSNRVIKKRIVDAVLIGTAFMNEKIKK